VPIPSHPLYQQHKSLSCPIMLNAIRDAASRSKAGLVVRSAGRCELLLQVATVTLITHRKQLKSFCRVCIYSVEETDLRDNSLYFATSFCRIKDVY